MKLNFKLIVQKAKIGKETNIYKKSLLTLYFSAWLSADRLDFLDFVPICRGLIKISCMLPSKMFAVSNPCVVGQSQFQCMIRHPKTDSTGFLFPLETS